MGKMLNVYVDAKETKMPIAKYRMHFPKSSTGSFCLLETHILVNLKLLFLYLYDMPVALCKVIRQMQVLRKSYGCFRSSTNSIKHTIFMCSILHDAVLVMELGGNNGILVKRIVNMLEQLADKVLRNT